MRNPCTLQRGGRVTARHLSGEPVSAAWRRGGGGDDSNCSASRGDRTYAVVGPGLYRELEELVVLFGFLQPPEPGKCRGPAGTRLSSWPQALAPQDVPAPNTPRAPHYLSKYSAPVHGESSIALVRCLRRVPRGGQGHVERGTWVGFLDALYDLKKVRFGCLARLIDFHCTRSA